ncbi:MAG: DUF1592 domain-containing protein [Mariniblastus sp.]
MHFIRNILNAALAGLLLSTSPAAGQEFRSSVAPLIEASCIDCHDGSEDNGLDFSSLQNDLTDGETFRKWERIFDRVESGEMPPASEARPSKLHKSKALDSIKKALTAENVRYQNVNGRVILRRLTRTEYQYTLNDLLYINAKVSEIIPSENSSSGFDTVFSAQGFSPLHITSYLEAADQALDDAIVLGEKPENKTRKFEMLKSKFITEHFKKKDERVIIGQTDDAAIMFNTASYLFKIDYHLEHAGVYKIRANASGYQTDRPVTLTLNSGNYNRGFTEILGFFDLEEGKPVTVETEAYLTRGQYLFPGAEDLYVQPDGKTIWNIGTEDYAGSGIAIRWVELEGPIYETWPPLSTTNLLKGVKLKKLKDKKWMPRRQTHHKYEITNPKDPEAKLQEIVAWLAPRAFRRPMVGGEGVPFVELGMKSLKAGGDFEEAVRVATRAVLTSPQFLFMTPKPGKLNDFELASRLSYFLWKSLPDHELFLLAKNKELSDPAILHGQVERMLKDKKALRFVTDFANQWLQLSEIDATAPDKYLYPEFDDLLKKSMLAETKYFLEHLIEEDLSTTNLIDSNFAFLNRRLAEHYGIENVKGQHFRKVKLDRDSPRGGILTQASVLKVTANGTNTSPVMRGNWVLTHLLGQPPSPPPPTVGSIEPDTRGTTTIREMLAKHRNDATCNSCHKLIDPPGFALENFDVIGGYRERFRSREEGERVKTKLLGRSIWEYKASQPVDASGSLPNGKTFKDVREYKKLLLSEKEQVARNMISQLMVYSTGAEIQFSDRAEVERILDVCRESNFGLRTMIHEVIKSKLFLNK